MPETEETGEQVRPAPEPVQKRVRRRRHRPLLIRYWWAIPVVAGIWPLVSVRNAEFMKNELRVSVPDSILERMARAQTPELARAEGVAIAREMLIAAKQMAQGAQISAPQGRYSSAVDVLEALG